MFAEDRAGKRFAFVVDRSADPTFFPESNHDGTRSTRSKALCQSLLVFIVVMSWAVVVQGESFESEVGALFQRRCLSCHNNADPNGDFSLTTSDDLRSSGYLDSDNVDASYLMELVTPIDGKAEMPKDSEPLSPDELATLRQWIAAGGNWPDGIRLEPLVVSDLDWWSLRPIPSISGSMLPSRTEKNPVDVFVDAMLKREGLLPVEQARPQTLIRRLTYDLTGLPPTPAEVDAFTRASKQDSEAAWHVAVDRLLDSHAFGEKWGQHWLDVARFAETHGYDKDKPRVNAWPYRDYVIRSFNEDKPYSRFVQEQVAGDVLFPDDPDGVLGLAFLAAGPWDFIGHWEVGEGKLDGRIAKHLDRDEMISATFNVFMSTTAQCAQCHHHKFDPIRMEDYYRLHAVFAAVDRADRVYDRLPQPEQQRKSDILSRISSLKKQRQSLTEKVNRAVAAQAFDVDRRIAGLIEEYGTDVSPQYGYHSQITSDPNDAKWVQLDLGMPRSVDGVRLRPAYDQFNHIGAGFGFPTRYRVEASDDAEFRQGVRVLLDATGRDHPNPQHQTIVADGDGRPLRYLRVTATKLAERKNDFIFALGEIEVLSEDGAENFARQSTVTAKDSIEQGVRWGKANLVDGIYYRELTNETAQQELDRLRDRRTAIKKANRPADLDERMATINGQLKRLANELQTFPPGRTVYAAATHFPGGGRFNATEGKPRPIYLLHRGDLRSPGDRMTPGAPSLWKNAPASLVDLEAHDRWEEADARAKLARYLTHRDNPLVWRSIVNRLWLWTFGSPLVATPNDFGRGGMTPTHPELLDYLAARLRDDPQQSLRSIIRVLVTSKAYRRSSRIDPEMEKLDADNVYRWRANRRRLTAEEFRDSLLAASGVLDRTMGGPSFQDFVIEKPEHSPHYEYHLHDPADEKSHRRSIYRFVVRSQPQPLLTMLDCADPSISVPQRDESTTALQALAAWNNRLVAFAASTLGERLKRESESPDRQIDSACRLVLCRGPTPLERDILKEHLNDHGPSNVARVLFNMNASMYLD